MTAEVRQLSKESENKTDTEQQLTAELEDDINKMNAEHSKILKKMQHNIKQRAEGQHHRSSRAAPVEQKTAPAPMEALTKDSDADSEMDDVLLGGGEQDVGALFYGEVGPYGEGRRREARESARESAVLDARGYNTSPASSSSASFSIRGGVQKRGGGIASSQEFGYYSRRERERRAVDYSRRERRAVDRHRRRDEDEAGRGFDLAGRRMSSNDGMVDEEVEQ